MATFGLIHGAWHDASCWHPLQERLEAMGHSVVAPELPLQDPDAGYRQRAQPVIEALAEARGSVIVVAHSQSSALGPLVAERRPISLLVYLCPGWAVTIWRTRRLSSARVSLSRRRSRTARRPGIPRSRKR